MDETEARRKRLKEAGRGFIRKESDPNAGYIRSVFSREMLLKMARDSPPGEWAGTIRVYGLALQALRFFFGPVWSERHIMDDAAPRGFLNRFHNVEAQETSFRRIINLAEMIVNLQHIRGVEAVFDEIYYGKIESAFAGLEAGKVLSCHGLEFRYIWAAKKEGHDFDIELKFQNGQLGCTEVESKAETTLISEKTIIRSLREGRAQLPPHYPGVVILKLPGKWWSGTENMKTIAAAINNFIRGTSLVVSVIIIFSVDAFENGAIHTWLHSLEVLGDNHMFDRSVLWRVLRDEAKFPSTWMDLTEIAKEGSMQ